MGPGSHFVHQRRHTHQRTNLKTWIRPHLPVPFTREITVQIAAAAMDQFRQADARTRPAEFGHTDIPMGTMKALLVAIRGSFLAFAPKASLSEIYECIDSQGNKRFTAIRSEAAGCKLLDIGPINTIPKPRPPKPRKPTPAPPEATQAAAREPLSCADKAQCDLYWQRAQIWIAKNSQFRVQSVTDTVLTTHGPSSSLAHALAFQVIKIPAVGGGAQITIDANCNDIYGQCLPHSIEAIASFKRFVRE